MNRRLMATAAVLGCFALTTSALAEGELLLLTDSPSGILAADAPLGEKDLIDGAADTHFEQLSAARQADLNGSSAQYNAAPTSINVVPEPGTLGLIALGGLFLLQRSPAQAARRRH